MPTQSHQFTEVYTGSTVCFASTFCFVSASVTFGYLILYWYGETVSICQYSSIPWIAIPICTIKSCIISFMSLVTGRQGMLNIIHLPWMANYSTVFKDKIIWNESWFTAISVYFLCNWASMLHFWTSCVFIFLWERVWAGYSGIVDLKWTRRSQNLGTA